MRSARGLWPALLLGAVLAGPASALGAPPAQSEMTIIYIDVRPHHRRGRRGQTRARAADERARRPARPDRAAEDKLKKLQAKVQSMAQQGRPTTWLFQQAAADYQQAAIDYQRLLSEANKEMVDKERELFHPDRAQGQRRAPDHRPEGRRRHRSRSPRHRVRAGRPRFHRARDASSTTSSILPRRRRTSRASLAPRLPRRSRPLRPPPPHADAPPSRGQRSATSGSARQVSRRSRDLPASSRPHTAVAGSRLVPPSLGGSARERGHPPRELHPRDARRRDGRSCGEAFLVMDAPLPGPITDEAVAANLNGFEADCVRRHEEGDAARGTRDASSTRIRLELPEDKAGSSP